MKTTKRYLKWAVAHMARVCEKTILRWEKKGIIPKAKRTAGNYRYWTESDLNIIKQVAGVQ